MIQPIQPATFNVGFIEYRSVIRFPLALVGVGAIPNHKCCVSVCIVRADGDLDISTAAAKDLGQIVRQAMDKVPLVTEPAAQLNTWNAHVSLVGASHIPAHIPMFHPTKISGTQSPYTVIAMTDHGLVATRLPDSTKTRIRVCNKEEQAHLPTNIDQKLCVINSHGTLWHTVAPTHYANDAHSSDQIISLMGHGLHMLLDAEAKGWITK